MRNITLVLGTAREGRKSERVYKYLTEQFNNQDNINLQTVDVKDHVKEAVTTPPWGEGGANEIPTKWKEIVANTDTFIFILPEYNHSFPGEWKILMDSLYPEYEGKEAYVVGVSGGVFSGVRVADQVRIFLVQLGLRVYKEGLFIGKASESLNEDGTVNDDKLEERAHKFISQVIS